MNVESEGRRLPYGGAIFTAVVVALMLYLSYAALQGEHGLLRKFQAEAEEARLQAALDELRVETAILTDRTERLGSEHPDADLLDEQARKVLGLGRPDEIIIE